VVSVESKGVARPRQVGSVKANASEPLMTGRNHHRRRQNRGFKRGPGISVGGDLSATDTTSGLKAARARIGLRYGTLEPVASMRRERPKRRSREAESTDEGSVDFPRGRLTSPREGGADSSARHRGGMIRSSDDRP